jgi:two-component sensor histidine kinase
MESLDKVGSERSLAQIVVETVHEPLLVLDESFTILAASHSFHRAFELTPEQTFHQPLFSLDGDAWDISELRDALERMLNGENAIDNLPFSHEFPRVGLRSLLLHLNKAVFDEKKRTTILLGFEDVTERRIIERDKELLQEKTQDLLKKEHILLQEMQHRVLNSLQIIASILMLKARGVTSPETRGHLEDAHRRVMSVAEVQKFLHTTADGERVEIRPYLQRLCGSLADSIIGETSNIKLQVECSAGTTVSSDAVSIGLIVTELVINALKYAFPDKKPNALVTVRYQLNGSGWLLSVSDNGVGRQEDRPASRSGGGLGTSIVAALSQQLGGKVEIVSSSSGMSVIIKQTAPTVLHTEAA